MSSDAEDRLFALYAADIAFVIGALMAPLLFAFGYVFDALIALSLAVAGAAYAMHRGAPWPGHAFLTFWRRDRK